MDSSSLPPRPWKHFYLLLIQAIWKAKVCCYFSLCWEWLQRHTVAITSTNQAVSKGNFTTSAQLHFMPLDLCYCSSKQHMLPAWILTILSLSEDYCNRSHRSCYCQEPVPWHLRQRQFKKPLCIYTCAMGTCDLTQKSNINAGYDPIWLSGFIFS